jgi:hypothetical protein
MTKLDPDVEELDSANPPPTPDAEVLVETPDADHYDGRSSKVSLAFPILHGDARIDFLGIVGPNEACIHCAQKGRRDFSHQLHLRCSKDKAGEWHGPDASLLRDLRELGHLRGTPEANARAEKNAEQARVLGVEKSSRCSMCGQLIDRNPETGELSALCPEGHRNGLSELKTITAADLRQQWNRELANGQEGAKKIEMALRREEAAALREAVQEGMSAGNAALVEVIRAVLKERK